MKTSRATTGKKEETNVGRVGVQGDERLDLELLLDHSILVGLLMEVPRDGLNDDLPKGGDVMSERSVRTLAADEDAKQLTFSPAITHEQRKSPKKRLVMRVRLVALLSELPSSARLATRERKVNHETSDHAKSVNHFLRGLARSVQARSPPVTSETQRRSASASDTGSEAFASADSPMMAATVARRNRGVSAKRALAAHQEPQKTESQMDHCKREEVGTNATRSALFPFCCPKSMTNEPS